MGIRLIKAKFEARDSGISIVEEAFFTPDEVELLELYSENYERMIGSRIFENSFPSLEKLSISSVEGISCIVSKFDHRDLYELLHVLALSFYSESQLLSRKYFPYLANV